VRAKVASSGSATYLAGISGFMSTSSLLDSHRFGNSDDLYVVNKLTNSTEVQKIALASERRDSEPFLYQGSGRSGRLALLCKLSATRFNSLAELKSRPKGFSITRREF